MTIVDAYSLFQGCFGIYNTFNKILRFTRRRCPVELPRHVQQRAVLVKVKRNPELRVVLLPPIKGLLPPIALPHDNVVACVVMVSHRNVQPHVSIK